MMLILMGEGVVFDAVVVRGIYDGDSIVIDLSG